jgi:iron complex outermembrane receptor protein
MTMPVHCLGRLGRSTAVFALLASSAARAEEAQPPTQPVPEAITVSAQAPLAAKYQLPQTVESTTAQQIEETTNVIDTEDALKYLPSLFLRKRNAGDNQAVLETRTWGVNASARSLVYADDQLLSALIANNNTIGAPRWGLVSPDEIERIDVLYGPFAAAYPGNSMGGVLQITTRMPDSLEASVHQTEAYQSFGQYSTHRDLFSSESTGEIGDRIDRFSFWASAEYLHSDSQPLAFVTSAKAPAGTFGTIPADNKLGAPADVVGAGGLLQSDTEQVKLKLAYDLTPALTLSYTVGYWADDMTSTVQSYLTDRNGVATFGGVSGFASNENTWFEDHLANALSLKTDTQGMFDGEAIFTNYTYLDDIQRTPSGVTPTGTGFTSAGKIARLDGTGWSTFDFKGIWRPSGPDGAMELSAGVHGDRYVLDNPTYATTNWQGDAESGPLSSDGRGKTKTWAGWAQDAWKFLPDWKLTLGGRYEEWQAYDGLNFSGKTSVVQPKESSDRFSPKASLSWQVFPDWQVTGSFGQAYRFPTVSELYQLVTAGANLVVPNPNLQPEKALTEELAIEHPFNAESRLRVSLFQEHVDNALISQTGFLTGGVTSTFTTNVDAVRNRGVEIAANHDNVLIQGLEFGGSMTYVDSIILSDPTFASTTGTTAVGKHVPNVPDWRATGTMTYRPDDRWAFTLAARYSGKQYSTLDNTDNNSHVFGAFDSFLVADLHVHYKLSDDIALDGGVDNLNNDKYFLFHPFPNRTFFAGVKASF